MNSWEKGMIVVEVHDHNGKHAFDGFLMAFSRTDAGEPAIIVMSHKDRSLQVVPLHLCEVFVADESVEK